MGKDFRKTSSSRGKCVVPISFVWLQFVCSLCFASDLMCSKHANVEVRSGPEMPQQLTSAAELLALAGELCQAGPAALVYLSPE